MRTDSAQGSDCGKCPMGVSFGSSYGSVSGVVLWERQCDHPMGVPFVFYNSEYGVPCKKISSTCETLC